MINRRCGIIILSGRLSYFPALYLFFFAHLLTWILPYVGSFELYVGTDAC